MNSEYGRGKPPKHTRYKKGVSGNPAGRPEGSKNGQRPLDIFDKQANKKRRFQTAKGYVEKTPNQVIIERLLESAIKGDMRAIKLHFDLMDKLNRGTNARIAELEAALAARPEQRSVLVVPGTSGQLEWLIRYEMTHEQSVDMLLNEPEFVGRLVRELQKTVSPWDKNEPLGHEKILKWLNQGEEGLS